MEDERNQGYEEEDQSLSGGTLLPPCSRPDLFEIPAQGLIGPFHLERQGIEAFLQADQGSFLLILRVPNLLERASLS